ncbi:MAG: hypothetical protein H0U49_02950 [Parachlamydiaceae bacterium]|nr:hypothetical protein [Parachlamydiaceae bacterium]
MDDFTSQKKGINSLKGSNEGSLMAKDKFELAEDQFLDFLIDKEGLLGDPKNNLLPPAQQRKKLKKDLHESAKQLDLDIDLAPALQILRDEGATYLDEEKYREMIDQLNKIPIYLDQLNLTEVPKVSLCTSLHIFESTLDSINKVAVAKYDEGNFEASYSIFGLLATLDHENEELLYRLGITATQMEKWVEALKSFTYALYLNSDLIGARVFSAQCFLKLEKVEDAKEEIKEARRLIEVTSTDPIWKELLASIESSLK